MLTNRKRTGSILVTITSAPAARTLLSYVQTYGVPGQVKALQQFIDGSGRRLYLRLPMPDSLSRGLVAAYTEIDWTDRGQPVELQPVIRRRNTRKAAPQQSMPLIHPNAQLAADLTLPIEELDLGVRPYNLLKREGTNTVGELIDRTEDDLLDIRNFGQKSIDEVKMKLAGMGLGLKEPERVPAGV